jgi:hypothetical protein
MCDSVALACVKSSAVAVAATGALRRLVLARNGRPALALLSVGRKTKLSAAGDANNVGRDCDVGVGAVELQYVVNTGHI